MRVGGVSPAKRCDAPAQAWMLWSSWASRKRLAERGPLKKRQGEDIKRLSKLLAALPYWLHPRLPSWWGQKRQMCDVARSIVQHPIHALRGQASSGPRRRREHQAHVTFSTPAIGDAAGTCGRRCRTLATIRTAALPRLANGPPHLREAGTSSPPPFAHSSPDHTLTPSTILNIYL
jgi:hypothetical protein